MGLLLPDHPAEAFQITPNPNPAGKTIVVYGADSNSSDSFVNLCTLITDDITGCGHLTNNGNLYNWGTLTNNYDMTNNGSLHNYEILNGYGYLFNNGSLYNYSDSMIIDDGYLANATNATLTNISTGSLKIISSGDLTNKGQLTNQGKLLNAATLKNDGTLSNDTGALLSNESGGELTSTGTLKIWGLLNNVNGATVTNASGGVLTNYDKLTNYGAFKNNGTIANDSGALLENKVGAGC